MTLEQLKTFPPDKVRALLGVTPAALAELLYAALPVLVARRREAQAARKNRKRAVGGGRARRLSPAQEVLLTLVYLRHNVAHALVGQMFDVSADTSENTFHEVVAVLRDVCPSRRWDAEKKWSKSEPSWEPDKMDQIIVDSFETPISRPSLDDAQRRVYSGKKKRHTVKTQVVTDKTGEIQEVDAGHRGPMADKKLYERSGVAARYAEARKQGDLGYQGVTGMDLPHKKPRGGALSDEQREGNRQHASVRVHVEHGIGRIKGFRILREDYRLALGLFGMIAHAVVGLVQLNRIVG